MHPPRPGMRSRRPDRAVVASMNRPRAPARGHPYQQQVVPHMQRAPMTKAGSERLRAGLEQLKSVDRPRVIAAIAEARARGDLKEIAEYHAAREQQGLIEGRIGQIEAALSTAQIIDPASLNAGGRVVFGAV